MRNVIILLLVLSLIVMGCSSQPSPGPIAPSGDDTQLPPPPPPPPAIGEEVDSSPADDAVVVDEVQEPLGDDLEQAMDGIDMDDW